jgi:hypothetical protein
MRWSRQHYKRHYSIFWIGESLNSFCCVGGNYVKNSPLISSRNQYVGSRAVAPHSDHSEPQSASGHGCVTVINKDLEYAFPPGVTLSLSLSHTHTHTHTHNTHTHRGFGFVLHGRCPASPSVPPRIRARLFPSNFV